MAIARRMLIIGVPVAALGAAGGVMIYRNAALQDAADDPLRDYERYLDEVVADYQDGRLAEIDGWILSVTEAAAYRELAGGS